MILNESKPKNPKRFDDIPKSLGRRPKVLDSRIERIRRIVRSYGVNTRTYSGKYSEALKDYKKVIESLGCEVTFTNGSDTEGTQSKTFSMTIKYDDGMVIDGMVKVVPNKNEGTYKTGMVLWPIEDHELNEDYIRNVVSESIRKFRRKNNLI